MNETPYETITRLLWEAHKEVTGKTPEELLNNWMNDRQNQSNNTHTIPVTDSRVITLGGNRTMAKDRGDVTRDSYSTRIAKIKTRICGCGDKLRGNEIQCGKCKNESFLNKL